MCGTCGGDGVGGLGWGLGRVVMCLLPYSEALPFFLLLIDLSKGSALAKIAFKSRNKVS